MHHTYLLMLGGQLHIVPFQENPQRILDVGTGTGIWAIDMAEYACPFLVVCLVWGGGGEAGGGEAGGRKK